MWTFEHTEQTGAGAERLWSHYADPASWPAWDSTLEAVSVQGPLVAGARGTLKPAGGPRLRFRVTELVAGRAFTTTARLPLARLHFTHRIEARATGAGFTHGVRIEGPLTPLFARVIGRGIAAELPATMRALARAAEGPRS